MIFSAVFYGLFILFNIEILLINHSIHSTLHKIIFSTQLCLFSTCQLNPYFLRGSNLGKRKNPRAGRIPL